MAGLILEPTNDAVSRRSSGVAKFWSAPHRQVGALIAFGVLLALSVVGLTIVRVNAARGPLDFSFAHLVAPEGHLRESKMLLSALTRDYVASFPLPSEQRALVVASLGADFADFTASFSSYEKEAVGYPGESALRERIAELLQRSSELSVTPLLSPGEVSTGLVGEYATTASELQETLQRIQSLYSTRIGTATNQASSGLSTARRDLLATTAAALAILGVSTLFVIRSLRRSWLSADAQAKRDELEAQVHRALELSPDEDAVFELVQEALLQHEPALRAEFLVADSSRAHLRQVMATNLEGTSGGCPVGSPLECPAAGRAQTQVFRSSRDLDACPFLKRRSGAALSAACVPVSIAGNTVGIIHAMSQEDHPPGADTIDTLELVARRAGEKIGMLRSFARSETQARTDPLTGLLNRRSLEAEAHEIADSGVNYSIAYGDLDHFKLLNDVHGHDAGDRALRLFARVLRDTVRPSDVPARYGGEEFVVVLPQCSVADAAAVIERVRRQLASVQQAGSGPEFTVSFGISGSAFHETLSETVEAADAALLGAKAAGRDRIVLADDPTPEHLVAETLIDDPSALDLPSFQTS